MSEEKPHYNVLIATPGRNVEIEYLKSFAETVDHLTKEGISWKFVTGYSAQVDGAREATVMNDNFLDIFSNLPMLGKATYDKMVWIDSDISWSVEDFMSVYESDYDIVSGVYSNDRGLPMFSVNGTSENNHELVKLDVPFEASHIGFGFVAVKQGIFEVMPRPWFGSEFMKVKNDAGEEKLIPYGEDYSWSIRARKAGFKIFVDPNVKLLHHKKIAVAVKV
jgi:hypothetical protein